MKTLLLTLLLMVVGPHRHAASAAFSLPLTAFSWNLLYSGTAPAPYNTADGSLAVDIAQSDSGGVEGYLMCPVKKVALAGTLVVTFTLACDSSVEFGYDTEPGNVCVFPASARPMFIGGKGQTRWWSNPIAFTLAPGSATITIPLTPDHWSNATGQFGANALADFQRSLADVKSIGMTFGGGCFFGHGVYATGPATLVVSDYHIE